VSFSVEVTPRKDTNGAAVHAVIVTIDGHETVPTFVSKDDAEGFAQVERARLIGNEKITSQRVREIAYRHFITNTMAKTQSLRQQYRLLSCILSRIILVVKTLIWSTI
jgi:hypothetical protein